MKKRSSVTMLAPALDGVNTRRFLSGVSFAGLGHPPRASMLSSVEAYGRGSVHPPTGLHSPDIPSSTNDAPGLRLW